MALALYLKTRATSLAFLLLVAISTCSEARGFNPEGIKLKRTDMVFYVRDWETGSNITTVIVAGAPTKKWGIADYSTIFAIDQHVTEGMDLNSTPIGRLQGIYSNTKLDGTSLHYTVSLVFSNQKYNGSTIEIQGANPFFHKYRDMSVVSGTGKFKMARGWATLETVYLSLVDLNAIIRWNMTVFHY